MCLSKPLYVYVYTIIIHIICEWHAETMGDGRGVGGEDILKLKKLKKCVCVCGGGGVVLTAFISKNRLKSFF